MKKETIIAIVFGISLGVAVALFYVFQSKENQLTKSRPIGTQSKASKPKINAPEPLFLTITAPSDNSIVDGQSIAVKGKANKDTLIVINSPVKEVVFKNEKDGFSVDFPLVIGENVIQMTVYAGDKTGISLNKLLKIYRLDTSE